MSRDARFWRNVTIIALVHIALLIALIRWSHAPKPIVARDITWMNAGAGDEGLTSTTPIASPPTVAETTPEDSVAPTPEPSQEEKAEEDKPILTSVPSDIHLNTPTPTPSATATPKPTATATPKPSATPKPTPKKRPTPSPTPRKKKIIAKAKPKPSATPKKKAKDEDEEETAALEKKKALAKAALAKNEKKKEEGEEESGDEKSAKKATAAHGSTKGGSGKNHGEGSGDGGASEFGWYGNMLHDRFNSAWVQPITVVETGVKFSVRVKLRIAADGTVSKFDIVNPSGNVVVDESVEAIAKRVTQVDALPARLGEDGHYDVYINFELNSGQ